LENGEILYKYRPLDCRSLSILRNRELYFSDPKHFNDPVDCQIEIGKAVQTAIAIAARENPALIEKLKKLIKLDDLYNKIQSDVKSTAIFSLSKQENNTLRWSHYAENHTGFSIGFDLPPDIKNYNKENFIVGTESVVYTKDNPFIDFFLEFAKSTEVPEWKEFWLPLFSLALVAKSHAWEYEKEVRVIRIKPGKVYFQPGSIKVIIFGLKMKERNRKKVRKILSNEVWSHVEQKEVTREKDGFNLSVVNC